MQKRRLHNGSPLPLPDLANPERGLPPVFILLSLNNNVHRNLASIFHVRHLFSWLYCSKVLIAKKKKNYRYNKYTQIAARAVRQSLKENERVAAEKRGHTALRYQHWEGGKGGEQVRFVAASRVVEYWLKRCHRFI